MPGRVIPRNRAIERAVWAGEKAFEQIGCASCHMTSLPLTNKGWVFSEPNPFNPPGNLQVGDAPAVEVNLNGGSLPGPRLSSVNGVVNVPAYTDLKLHNISSGPHDANWVPIDLNAVPPTGIAGIKPHEKAADQDGQICYGAIGVGGLKMKLHKAAIRRLFESNDVVLDAEQVFALGGSI